MRVVGVWPLGSFSFPFSFYERTPVMYMRRGKRRMFCQWLWLSLGDIPYQRDQRDPRSSEKNRKNNNNKRRNPPPSHTHITDPRQHRLAREVERREDQIWRKGNRKGKSIRQDDDDVGESSMSLSLSDADTGYPSNR